MKKYFILGIIVLALLVWLGWLPFSSAGLEVTKPVRGAAVQAVYATGTVEATVMLPLAPRVSARLLELNFDEGSEVKKGQILSRFEDKDAQSSLQQLKAQADFAEKTYARNAELVKRGVLAKAEYDRARADLDAAKAAVAKARAEADYLTLTAPADGRIIKRDGEIGQLFTANQPLFWLSCCAPLRISAEVDEEDVALVQPNQKVLIRADAFPNKVFNGKVLTITPKGDPVSRSYRVRVEFSDENPLLIGMTAETNIIISEKEDALLLPTTAATQNKIWIVRDGKLAQIEVEIGANGKEQVEVISGVTPDDMVVTKPTKDLKDGQSVNYSLKQWTKP